MPRVHFLNVGQGDCSIIEHSSRRVSMIDICGGNISETEEAVQKRLSATLAAFETTVATSNHNMKEYPTNPVRYCKEHSISSIFRFIITHPDMDHMNGLENLITELHVQNVWEPGIRRNKPDFANCPYQEGDWDCYQKLIDRKWPGITVLSNLAGATFEFANKGDAEHRGDCLSIVAPNKTLVAEANSSEDFNDGSYVIVYRSCGGNIIFPGDAHDETWNYVMQNYFDMVNNCAVLVAPHHGRKSERYYNFLDVLKPRLTLFGNAPSEHLAYNAWNTRNLPHITNNQAGNIILESKDYGIDVYVENVAFASQYRRLNLETNNFGCYYIASLPKPAEETPAKRLYEALNLNLGRLTQFGNK